MTSFDGIVSFARRAKVEWCGQVGALEIQVEDPDGSVLRLGSEPE